MSKSHLEARFSKKWQRYYPEYVLQREKRIIPKRRFAFDFVHFNSKVAIEINGGLHIKSNHTTAKGISRDYEKNNLAIAQGWVVFQISAEMINNKWLKIIAETIKNRLGD